MNGRTATLVLTGLVALGIVFVDVGARSQSQPAPGGSWAIEAGGTSEVWKLNTRTGELYHCISAQATPKVVCSK